MNSANSRDGPPVASVHSIPASDGLEVLGGPPRHVENVSSRCTQFEDAALVILDVIAYVAHQINGQAGPPCSLHEQPGRRRHNPDRSSNRSADRPGHVLCIEEFRSSGAIALPGVPCRIHQGGHDDSREILIRRRGVAACAVHPRKDAQMLGQPNRRK
jgi:hypothetical protein